MAAYVEVEKAGKVIGKIIQSDDMKVTVEPIEEKYKKDLQDLVKPTYTFVPVEDNTSDEDMDEEEESEEEDEDMDESDEDEDEEDIEPSNETLSDGVRDVPTSDPIWLLEIGNHAPKGYYISLPKKM